MLRLKIGIHLPSLRMPLRKAIPRAAELGAEAIEIDGRGELKPRDLSDTAVREIRKLLDDNRLRVAAISFRTRRGYDTPDELERRIDATRQAMDMAYRLVPAWSPITSAIYPTTIPIRGGSCWCHR